MMLICIQSIILSKTIIQTLQQILLRYQLRRLLVGVNSIHIQLIRLVRTTMESRGLVFIHLMYLLTNSSILSLFRKLQRVLRLLMRLKLQTFILPAYFNNTVSGLSSRIHLLIQAFLFGSGEMGIE